MKIFSLFTTILLTAQISMATGAALPDATLNCKVSSGNRDFPRASINNVTAKSAYIKQNNNGVLDGRAVLLLTDLCTARKNAIKDNFSEFLRIGDAACVTYRIPTFPGFFKCGKIINNVTATLYYNDTVVYQSESFQATEFGLGISPF